MPLPLLLEPYLDESHHAFAESCRRFALDVIAPNAEAWEEAGEFPRELYRQAAEAGVLAPTQDEALGGGGGDVFHGVVAGIELLRGGSTGVQVGLGSLQIAIPPIVMLGSDDQLDRFVRPVLAGERIAALAITEPNTGSDVASVRTRARREGPDGDYVLSGAKTYITSGVRADVVVVLARTDDDPHGGLTFFVVEKGMPGFEVSRALRKTGWWASDTAELSFDDVRVPAANRLGEEGTGFATLMKDFESERLMLAINGTALATLSLEHALAYAKQREAFGRPISKFQVIRHKLADMRTRVASAQALTFAVADRMRRGEPCVDQVAMAKNHASDVAREVCWQAVQIFGGMGYMRETVVERFARDARLLPIGGGTQEVMNEIIWRFALEHGHA